MQTGWMLEQMQKDIATLKTKKVAFLLGGTNDVFSNRSASHIIANLDAMVKIAHDNGVKIVVGTIPPFSPDTQIVKKALKKLNTNADERNKVIEEVNDHIRANYDFIDYHAMVRDPNRPTYIDKKYEAKKNPDGIHMYNAYSMMREAQKKKMQEIEMRGPVVSKSPKNLQNTSQSLSENTFEQEIEKTIAKTEQSMVHFEHQMSAVFSEEKITPEQKTRAEEIVNQTTQLLSRFRDLKKEIEQTSQTLAIKKHETRQYESANFPADMSREYLDFQQRFSDLQKLVWELEESQEILLKEF